MNRFAVLLTSCALIALPATLAAQRASLEICNHGPIPVDVAYAARIQLFITGYRWATSGWWLVKPGACTTVYDESYDEAGPITPQSGARVALVAEVGKSWRALQRSAADTQGWMLAGSGKICVDLNANGFQYQEPQGDPAASCSVMAIPAAWDFLPAEPGQYSYTINWDGGAPSVVIAGADGTAASATAGTISYFCSSTDQRPVMYFSDLFDVPDAGSDADNFLTYEHVLVQFQIYLAEHYQFPGDDGLVACVHLPTVAGTANSMAEKKGALTASVTSAGKKFVQTGWKYLPGQPATDASTTGATNDDVIALNATGRAALAGWVREYVAKYLAASKTGFNAYKSGDVILQQGLRMWTSSEKPTAARGCWVVQGDSTTTLSCTIPINQDRERAYYDVLGEDVAAALPADWSAEPPNPFGGSLPSRGFKSTSGAHGEIWLTETPAGEYELNVQLVSAAVKH